MPAAILNQGQTIIRNAIKAVVTHVVISEDTTAFSAAHTGINPAANMSVLVKAATEADVDFQTEDYTISINGDTEFTNEVINCIGIADGTAVLQSALGTGTGYGSPTIGTDTISRSMRGTGLGWGIQAGDVVTVGVRAKQEDNS